MITIVRYKLVGEEFIPEYVGGPIKDTESYRKWLGNVEGFDLLLSTMPKFANGIHGTVKVLDDNGNHILYNKYMWGSDAAFVVAERNKIVNEEKTHQSESIDVSEVHLITLFQLDDTDFVDTRMFDNAIDALKEIPIMKGRL